MQKKTRRKKKVLTECRKAEASAKAENSNSSQFMGINHIETVMLKLHRISKSCYHAGDLEGNDIRRLMAKGTVFFRGD